MGGLGGAVALFGGGALYKLGVPLPFIVGAGVMLIAILVVLLAVREPAAPLSPVRRGDPRAAPTQFARWPPAPTVSGLYLLAAIFAWFVGWNAMEAFFTIYARSVLGVRSRHGTQMLTAFAAALIVFAIPSGLIATRVGRKPTILIGLVGMLLGLVGRRLRAQSDDAARRAGE